MATSGSSNFAPTFREVGTYALRMIGVTPHDEDPSAEEAETARYHANLMVKTWSADPNPRLFLLTETSLTLVASTRTYDLITTPGARKIIEARRRTGTGTATNDVQLTIDSRSDYLARPNKFTEGTPLSVWFDPQRATRTLYVWPVPSTAIAASTTLRYTYLRVIEDFDSLDNDPDVPQEWIETLQYSLAARLIAPFKVHISDPTGAAAIMQRAAELYGQLSSYDDEGGSVFMQPAA